MNVKILKHLADRGSWQEEIAIFVKQNIEADRKEVGEGRMGLEFKYFFLIFFKIILVGGNSSKVLSEKKWMAIYKQIKNQLFPNVP